jgi:hypothetical protein
VCSDMTESTVRIFYEKRVRASLGQANRNSTFFKSKYIYRSADKSLARPISRCILFDSENISFDASLVFYIYIYIYIYIVLIFLQL